RTPPDGRTGVWPRPPPRRRCAAGARAGPRGGRGRSPPGWRRRRSRRAAASARPPDRWAGVLGQVAAPPQEARHAIVGLLQEMGDLLVGGGRQRVEDGGRSRSGREHQLSPASARLRKLKLVKNR